ncbi:MAG TPA: MBOAT family O-acyltransferase [Acidisphaera sp.]|nr:MBOAT family O-acyltransferase [Acidisphaera sp.]
MLFYEPLFLFAFFPAVYLVYLLGERRRQARGLIILLASVVFYTWSEPLFVPVVFASAFFDHWVGRHIAHDPNTRRSRVLLALGVLSNLGILVFYKYTRFAIENIDALLTGAHLTPLPVPDILLPIGVSFIVFEKITYLMDIRRELCRPAPNFHTYLLYVFFFPKLLAGPIIKYHEMEAQIRALPPAGFDDFCTGFARFMLGVVKKTILADTLGQGADMVFGDTSGQIGFANAWWGVAFFTFMIYFDFSAYSDMAIGIARMLGIRLRENFDKPYTSASITEFWRRWHISLSTWIREYMYIPLGGNRVGVARQYVNLWLCFLASGLWHGAAWTYVLWGAYNGLFLMLDKMFLLRVLNAIPRLAATALTFAIVMVGWTIFRATSIEQIGAFFAAMTDPSRAGLTYTIWISPDLKVALAASAIICAVPLLPGYARARALVLEGTWLTFGTQTATLLLFVLAVGKALADPFRAFIYFRF